MKWTQEITLRHFGCPNSHGQGRTMSVQLYKIAGLDGAEFVQAEEIVTTSNSFQSALEKDVSKMEVFTYIAVNTGSNDAVVKVEISPDQTIWLLDVPETELRAGESKSFVTATYLKYARISYKSAGDNDHTDLHLYFNGRTVVGG